MNKLILLFFIILFGLSANAQVSEITAENWYLKYLEIDGQRHYSPLGEEVNIHFDEDGENYIAFANGVLNNLFGEVTFLGDNMAFNDVSVTLLDCDVPNCYYENLYFQDFLTTETFDLKTFTYDYNSYSNDKKTLTLIDANGNRAYYGNEPVEPDPTLFKTWYLYEVEVDLGETEYIDSPNPPQITINPDFSFTGIDNCYQLSGDFEYGEDFVLDFILQTEDFEKNDDNCTPDNNGYTLLFFEKNVPLNCSVGSSGDISYLSIESLPGFIWHFRDVLLSDQDNSFSDFKIFPNPANDFIIIETSLQNFDEVIITDINGRIIKKSRNTSEKKVDISPLSSGVYFIQIESSKEGTVKKFIKK